MRCGLYGKLPSKRDFVSIATPRNFLLLWEAWLAECLTQSRANLGEDRWRQAFCNAPVWRFRLAPDGGSPNLFGAFMPSMDAIGRYFPLTLVASENAADFCAKPEDDLCQSWFDAAEEFLLSIVNEDLSRDMIDAGLADLVSLTTSNDWRDNHPEPLPILYSTLDDNDDAARPLAEIFPEGRRLQGMSANGLSYWWTIGSDTYSPRALVQKSMPDPAQFAAMLGDEWASPHYNASQSG